MARSLMQLEFPLSAVAFLLIAASGCGTQGPELSEVTGLVTFNGQPVENVFVEFAPEKKIGAARAVTGEDGRFRLIYNRKIAGAMVGTNKVSFDEAIDNHRITIPQRYTPGFSDLTVTVVPDGPNEFTFDLTSQ